MAKTYAKISSSKNTIVISLPITAPSSKIRVKERPETDSFGHFFPTRKKEIDNKCYVEWQIGYESNDKDKEGKKNKGIIKKIKFKRNEKLKYGYELSRLLYLAVKNDIIEATKLDDLIEYINSIEERELLDKPDTIKRIPKSSKVIKGITFNEFTDIYNTVTVKKDDYIVECSVRHKQRAIGYQTMIYVCLPLNKSVENIVGRKANKNEYVKYILTKTNNNFIIDCIKIFALTSQQHKEDVRNIINAVKSVIR
ncbi:MAG: R.Pab1 family restriction endonuclease [Ignavibacteria bacterium]|nr:R.Pab1 family restriction endonuclease [Ignavibacteria bacterium]